MGAITLQFVTCSEAGARISTRSWMTAGCLARGATAACRFGRQTTRNSRASSVSCSRFRTSRNAPIEDFLKAQVGKPYDKLAIAAFETGARRMRGSATRWSRPGSNTPRSCASSRRVSIGSRCATCIWS